MSHAPDTRFAVLYDDGSMNVGQAGQTVEHAEAQRAWDGISMYHPYFRGKQYELITVRETADLMAASQFVPIIEPVKESLGGLERTLKAVCDAGRLLDGRTWDQMPALTAAAPSAAATPEVV